MSVSSEAGHMTTEELFRQHAGFVARFLSRRGVPEEQIEDAVQEVFLVVHRNGGYRPGIAKPISYLGSIAVHAANKHRRRESIDRRRRSEGAVERLASETADPARSAQVQQDLQRLQLALDRLPEELRTTLLLVEVEGESCLSVAAAFGWPVGTVYWRLHQARKKLQSALKSVDAERTHQRRVAAPVAAIGRRPLTNLGSVMLFGMESSFNRSEAGRLLRLAREQPPPRIALDQLLVRHQQLVQSGAELPSWAAGCAPQATSMVGLIGTGPIVTGLALGGAMLVAAVLLSNPTAPELDAALIQSTPSPGPAAPVVEPEPEQTAAATAEAPGESESAPAGDDATTTDALVPGEAVAPSVSSRALKEQRALRETTGRPVSPDAATRPGVVPTGDEAAMEMRLVGQAERLLSTAPERALLIARGLETRFPQGYFREERAYVEVMALFRLGRTREGRSKADRFLRAYPDGPYSRRVRSAVASAAKAGPARFESAPADKQGVSP